MTRRKLLSASLFLAMILGFPAAVAFAEPTTAIALSAQQQLDAARLEHGVPGMTAAVWKDGKIIWSGASGRADLELDVPARPTTMYRLASVSKIVTAAAALKMAQQGVIDLDAPIATYLPDLPPELRAITLRQTLAHTAGIRHYGRKDFNPDAPGGIIDARTYPGTDEALELFIHDELVHQPGEAYSYSTFGYTLASAAMEAASGESFDSLIERHVGGPLGLDSLRIEPRFDLVPLRTRHYESRDGVIGHAAPQNTAYKKAGGGMLANAQDVARLGAAFLQPGYLEEKWRREALSAQTDHQEKGYGGYRIGLGWRISKAPEFGEFYHHAGGMAGARSYVVIYPRLNMSIALLSNLSSTPDRVDQVASGLARIFAD